MSQTTLNHFTVSSQHHGRIEAARKKAIELFTERGVSPLSPAQVNSWVHFTIWDIGSKDGWPDREFHLNHIRTFSAWLNDQRDRDGGVFLRWSITNNPEHSFTNMAPEADAALFFPVRKPRAPKLVPNSSEWLERVKCLGAYSVAMFTYLSDNGWLLTSPSKVLPLDTDMHLLPNVQWVHDALAPQPLETWEALRVQFEQDCDVL